MLNKYILGNKKIETTEERYNRVFKDMGYIPYVEKKQEKEIAKEETKTTSKKVEDKKIK